jgi:hypothetical protein
MATINHSSSISRRKVLAGMSAGLAATALPLSAYAFPAGRGQVSGGIARKSGAEQTLAKYLCSEVHGKIATKLDAIIADPLIDGEQTSLALMEARCPGCGKRVEPASSRISAVIPQWKPHVKGPQKYGVTA